MLDFIEVYDNVFPEDYCDALVEQIDVFEEAGFTHSRADTGRPDTMMIQDKAVFVPFDRYKYKNTDLDLSHFDSTYTKVFLEQFWEICYKQYYEKYGILRHLEDHKIYSIKLQKTKPSEGYHTWHCEHGGIPESKRVLSYIVYLNDDFEAGETEFLYHQKRIKPKKGTCLLFPAAFTHPHRGNPPINGTKYIATGWVEF